MSTDPTTIAAELFGQLERGWNAGNGDAFAEPFSADADFIDTRGFHHHGHDEVASSHVMILGTKFKGTSVHYEVADARELRPGCILAHAKATMTSTTGAFQRVGPYCRSWPSRRAAGGRSPRFTTRWSAPDECLAGGLGMPSDDTGCPLVGERGESGVAPHVVARGCW